MERIALRSFEAEDRQRVHDAAVASATTRTEDHVAQYMRHPDSFGGRYVSADLYKETFEQFRASPEARSRYNAPVHNAAAVLASDHLRRLLANGPAPGAEIVVMLTGVPGAGKTSTVINAQQFPAGHRAIYEGQMSNPATAVQKLDQVLGSGHRVVVVVAHGTPEDALRNTLRRFSIEGRGAGVGVMADIQGRLPESLRQVHERYGDRVDLIVNDLRDRAHPRILQGWEHLRTLGSEGSRDYIEQRLRAELDRQGRAGAISVEAFRQAHGAAPLGPYLGLAREGERGQREDADRSGLPAADRAAAFVHSRPDEALKAHPGLKGTYQALEAVAAVAAGRGELGLSPQQEATAKAQERLHGELERGLVHAPLATLGAERRGPSR